MHTHFVRTANFVVQFDADPPFRPDQLASISSLHGASRSIDEALSSGADEGQSVANVIVVPVAPATSFWRRARTSLVWRFVGKKWP